MTAPAIEALRAATAEAHRRVEAPFATLMDPDPSLDVYARFLVAMHAFHASMEAALGRAEVVRGERAQLLAADLAALGVAADDRCVAPSLESRGRALGAAYVVEGSALGARVLHRHLSKKLAGAPFAFLAAHGDAAMTAWRALVDSLAAYDGSIDDLVAGALATFEALDAFLSR